MMYVAFRQESTSTSQIQEPDVTKDSTVTSKQHNIRNERMETRLTVPEKERSNTTLEIVYNNTVNAKRKT